MYRIAILTDEDVERAVGNLRLGRAKVLRKVEVWAPTRIQRYERAVDHCSVWQEVSRLGDESELFFEYVRSGCEECGVAGISHSFKTVSIKFDPVGPFQSFGTALLKEPPLYVPSGGSFFFSEAIAADFVAVTLPLD